MTATGDDRETVFIDLSGLPLQDLLRDDEGPLAQEIRRAAHLARHRTHAIAGFQSGVDESLDSP